MFLTTQEVYVSYYTGRLCFLLHREVMFLSTEVGYVSYCRVRLCFLLHRVVMFLTTQGGYVSIFVFTVIHSQTALLNLLH
jgi:hypothetical protein